MADLLELAKKIEANAATLRESGCPEPLNRWATMTPQKLEEQQMAQKIGPREQALRLQRLPTTDRPFDPYAKEHAENKRLKAKGRIAAMKAKLSGEAAKMPLEGKAALAAIDQPPEAPAPAQPKEESAVEQTASIETGAVKRKAPRVSKPKTKTPKKAKAAKVAKVKVAKAKKPSAPKAAKTEGVREGTKLALVVGLLKRSEGCTTADVLSATGWPSVSMPQQAKAAGLKLRKEKDGKVSRYFAE